MISLGDVYHVVEATVPLYVAMSLGYISLKWLKLFTSDQSSGINKFVAQFSVPLLSFQVISTNNPYKMNMKLVYADFLQKLFAFLVLVAILKLRCRGNLSWIITGLSLSTLPNSLILGIPTLRAMYGDDAAVLLSQIVVLQSLIWYNLLLFLFEINTMTETDLMPPTEATGDLEVSEETQPKGVQEVKIATSWKTKAAIVLSKVGKKLLINPNTHATISAVIWASISFRWGVKLPKIVDQSIKILSDGGLGMAMFSLGLFMASQASIIACGPRKTALAMAMKFAVGPSLMAVAAVAIRLRGTTFRVAIVQAALPQGIVPFVFAREYNIHPDILGTGVIFGMLIALPVALAYYFLLEL